jgi:hypothetical protein
MYSQTIIRIVRLKGLILVGYILQLKSRIKIWPAGGIYGAAIAIFKKGTEEGWLKRWLPSSSTTTILIYRLLS